MNINDISLANRHPIFELAVKASGNVVCKERDARLASMRAGKEHLFVEMASHMDSRPLWLPTTIKATPEELNNGLWDFKVSYEGDVDDNNTFYTSIHFGPNVGHDDLYDLFRDEMISTGDEEWIFDTRTVIEKVSDLAGELTIG